MKKLHLAYFGSPDFAASLLEKILTDSTLSVEVKLVVTQPDKPMGRKQVLTATPVKQIAENYKIPVFDQSVKSLHDFLSDQEIDLALLYAYGEIIPTNLIEKFPVGFWNIHPSLLPLYRNVAPMAYPLMLGETKTGVSIIQLDDKLDHGPILEQREIAISPDDRRPDLERKLTNLAYEMFKELVSSYTQSGKKPESKEQDHTKATYTRMMKKDDGYIPFVMLKKHLANTPLPPSEFPQILREYYANYPTQTPVHSSALLLYNLFRGLSPWPGLWTKVEINGEEKRLKLSDMKFENDTVSLTKVQLEGKNEVEFGTFQQAYPIF